LYKTCKASNEQGSGNNVEGDELLACDSNDDNAEGGVLKYVGKNSGDVGNGLTGSKK
jgi:hypothetical protein